MARGGCGVLNRGCHACCSAHFCSSSRTRTTMTSTTTSSLLGSMVPHSGAVHLRRGARPPFSAAAGPVAGTARSGASCSPRLQCATSAQAWAAAPCRPAPAPSSRLSLLVPHASGSGQQGQGDDIRPQDMLSLVRGASLVRLARVELSRHCCHLDSWATSSRLHTSARLRAHLAIYNVHGLHAHALARSRHRHSDPGQLVPPTPTQAQAHTCPACTPASDSVHGLHAHAGAGAAADAVRRDAAVLPQDAPRPLPRGRGGPAHAAKGGEGRQGGAGARQPAATGRRHHQQPLRAHALQVRRHTFPRQPALLILAQRRGAYQCGPGARVAGRRRMEEVRANEVRATLEDLMYVSILEKFVVLGVEMLPRMDGEHTPPPSIPHPQPADPPQIQRPAASQPHRAAEPVRPYAAKRGRRGTAVSLGACARAYPRRLCGRGACQPARADREHPQQGGAGAGPRAPHGRHGPHRAEPVQQRGRQDEQVPDGAGEHNIRAAEHARLGRGKQACTWQLRLGGAKRVACLRACACLCRCTRRPSCLATSCGAWTSASSWSARWACCTLTRTRTPWRGSSASLRRQTRRTRRQRRSTSATPLQPTPPPLPLRQRRQRQRQRRPSSGQAGRRTGWAGLWWTRRGRARAGCRPRSPRARSGGARLGELKAGKGARGA